jgi:serine/threonine protein kinase/CHASE1-domain containing sensor protein
MLSIKPLVPKDYSDANTSVHNGILRRLGVAVRAATLGYSILMLLFGVFVSVAVFLSVRSRQRVVRRIEFDRAASQIALQARSSFDIPLEVVRGVAAFFEASDFVTRAEFRVFVTNSLVRYPWIYALEWIPRTPRADRAAMEAAAEADGLLGFHFKQDAPAGPPILAAERDEYYPLYYMEPINSVAVGIEETALTARRVALERARDLDTTAITERLRLVQDEASVPAVIAFHPVYRGGHAPDIATRRQRLQGYAAAVFRIREVASEALPASEHERYDLVLLDRDTHPPTVLFESRGGAFQHAAQSGLATWEQSATVAGRKWTLCVSDHANWTRARDSGWLELAVGLVISLLLAACTAARHAVLRLRRQVKAARRFGQYTLVEKLGEGGMGTVYRAHHALLRRPTAIKLLHAADSHPSALARFESEVQLTATLTHPNTVVVYDYGRSPSNVFYYAMEYIQGATLQDIVDACGSQAPERVVPILIQICSALAEAHGIGLVHRDIKPANIMLCTRGNIPDFVKVLDFGLVKDLTANNTPELSKSAALIGTPLYVAPEVALRRQVDARADVYAVGAVAYFLLTGTPVFTGKTVFEVLAKHLTVAPDSISTRLGHAVPADLDAIIAQCLAKDPADRPSSAQTVVDVLRKLTLIPWTTEQVREWWAANGTRVEARAHEQRSAQELPSEQTLDVDRENTPPGLAHESVRGHSNSSHVAPT